MCLLNPHLSQRPAIWRWFRSVHPLSLVSHSPSRPAFTGWAAGVFCKFLQRKTVSLATFKRARPIAYRHRGQGAVAITINQTTQDAARLDAIRDHIETPVERRGSSLKRLRSPDVLSGTGCPAAYTQL